MVLKALYGNLMDGWMVGLIGRVGFEWMDWLNYTGFLGDVCVTFFAWKQRCRGTKPPHERKKRLRLKL